MFGHDAGLWEAATLNAGVVAMLVIGGVAVLGAFAVIILGMKFEAPHWASTTAASLILLSLGALGFFAASALADNWNHMQAKENAYSQIEQKYNVDVQSFSTIRIDGGDTMSSAEASKVYGVLRATAYSEDGNWTDLEFKYSFTKGEGAMLYPIDSETKDKTPIDPKQFLK